MAEKDTRRERSGDGKMKDWARAFGASTAFSSVEVLKNITPYTSDLLRGTATELKGLQRATTAKMRAASKTNEKMKKPVNAIFARAMQDLSTGNYSLSKTGDDLYEEFNTNLVEDFETSTPDGSLKSQQEITSQSSAGISKSVIASGTATLEGMQASTNMIIKSFIHGQKGTADSISATTLYAANMLNNTMTGVYGKLDAINHNLVSMIEFQNKNVSVTNQAMLRYMDTSSKMLSSIGKMMAKSNDQLYHSEDRYRKMNAGDVSSKYGFNMSAYKKTIQQNIDGSPLGLIMTGIQLMGSAGGGDARVVKSAMENFIIPALIPKSVKTSLKKADRNMSTYVSTLLETMGDWGRGGTNSAFKQIIGSIFGIDRARVKAMDLSKYNKDAMSWNGLAQKSIVEVIPEYLATIASAVTKQEKFYMDYQSGKFMRESEIRSSEKKMKEFDAQLAISEMSDKLIKYLDKKEELTSRDKDRVYDKLDDIINKRINDTIDPRSKAYRSAVSDALGPLSATEFKDIVVRLEDSIRTLSTSRNDYNHRIGSTQHVAKNIYNKSWDSSAEKAPSTGSFFALGRGNGSNASNLSREVYDILARAYPNGDPAAIRKASKNRDILNTYVTGFGSGRASNEIEIDIVRAARRFINPNRVEAAATQAKKWYDNHFKYGTPNIASRAIDRGDTAIFNRVMGYDIGAASSNASKRTSDTSSASVKLRKKSFDQVMNNVTGSSPAATLKRGSASQKNLGRAIGDLLRTEDKSAHGDGGSLEETVASSSRATQLAMLQMTHNMHSFGSTLFGEDGIIRNMWDSDWRKKEFALIKEKLFNEKDGIFKDQVASVKSGLRKTRDHLVNGYDFVYTNTMKHLFQKNEGERYQDNSIFQKYFKWMDIKGNLAAKAGQSLAGTSARKMDDKTAKGTRKDSRFSKVRLTALDSVDAAPENAKLSVARTAVANMTVNAGVSGAEAIADSAKAMATTLFGSKDKSKKDAAKEVSKGFGAKLKSILPKAAAAGVIGAGASLLTGGSLGIIGSLFLPSNPIGAAIVGAGGMILSQTEAFKSVLYGKMNDKTGERTGGLVNKKLSEGFKKSLPLIVGSATLGALKNVVFGSPKGPLGLVTNTLLPGGPIGGAILGLGVAMLKNNESFKSALFGKADEKGTRNGTFLSRGFNKARGAMSKLMPTLGRGAAGAATGALTGAVMANMGLIPAAFSFGGPVGMGLMGLGLGIASSTKKFNAIMFGSEELDKDGNLTGNRRKDGFITRAKNLFTVNVFDPLKDKMTHEMSKFGNWIKKEVTIPFRAVFGPILDSVGAIKDDVVDFVKDKFDMVGRGITSIFTKTVGAILNPVGKILKGMGSASLGMLRAGAQGMFAPVAGVLKIAQLATMGSRRDTYIDFYKNYVTEAGGFLKQKWDAQANTTGHSRGLFGKARDVFDVYLNPDNEFRKSARAGFNAGQKLEGRNHLGWMDTPADRRDVKAREKEEDREAKKWAKISKIRSTYSKELGGVEDHVFRSSKLKEMQKRFKSAGLDIEGLDTSEKMNELIYHAGDWRKKYYKKDGTVSGGSLYDMNNITVNETDDQKHARTETAKYQDDMRAILKRFEDAFILKGSDAARAKTANLTEEKARKRRNKLYKNLKKMGINPEEHGVTYDADVMEMTDDEWDSYRASPDYKKGNFRGWFRKNSSTLNGPSSGSPIAEGIKKMATETEQIKKANISMVRLASGGEISEEDIAKQGYSPKVYKKFAQTPDKIAGAVSHGVGSFFNLFYSRKRKDDKSAARTAREADEQRQASALGDDITTEANASVAEMVESGNKSGLLAKAAGLGSSILGKGSSLLGTVIGALSSGSTAEKILLGTIGLGFIDKVFPNALSTFTDKIIPAVGTWLNETAFPAVTKKLPDAITAFTNFALTHGVNVIQSTANTIAQLMPTIIPGVVQIASAGISTTWDMIRAGLGFKSSTKILDADQASAMTAAGINYSVNADGTLTVGGARDLGNGQTVGNSSMSSGIAHLGRNTVTALLRGGTSGAAAQHLIQSAGKWGGRAVGAAASLGVPMAIPVVSAAGGKLGETIARQLGRAGGAIRNIIPDGGRVAGFIGKEAAETTAETVAKNVTEVALKDGRKLVLTELGQKTTKEVLENTSEGFLKKTFAKMHKIFEGIGSSKLVDQALKEGGEAATKAGTKRGIIKIFQDATKKLADYIMSDKRLIAKVFPTLQKRLGESVLKANPLGLIFTGWDLVSGFFEAAHLFGVSNSEVNWKMQLISSLMKTLLGIAFIGPCIDILFELCHSVMGVNIKQTIATMIYSWMSNDDEEDDLFRSRAALELEKEIYNSKNELNLSTDAYNDLKNIPWYKKIANSITGKSNATPDHSNEVTEAMIDARVAAMRSASGDPLNTATAQNFNNQSSGSNTNTYQSYREYYTDPNKMYAVGYGSGSTSNMSQKDSRWSNYSLGRYANGKIATMADAGCGPTAMSMVASSVSGKQISPVAMGALAKAKGYISNGGANAGLFTEGAANLGLRPTALQNSSDLARGIASGSPIIMSGVSSQGSSTPFTKAGHIVVANGVDNSGRVIVKDPSDGQTKRYRFSDLANNVTNSWAYGSGKSGSHRSRRSRKSVGYGAADEIDVSKYAGLKKKDFMLMPEEQFKSYISDMYRKFDLSKAAYADDIGGLFDYSNYEHDYYSNPSTTTNEMRKSYIHALWNERYNVRSMGDTRPIVPFPDLTQIDVQNAKIAALTKMGNAMGEFGTLTLSNWNQAEHAANSLISAIEAKSAVDRTAYDNTVSALKRFVSSGTSSQRTTATTLLNRLEAGRAWQSNAASFDSLREQMELSDYNSLDFHNGIPFYSAKDPRWSTLKYRNGTIESNGSDVTSLAMLLSAYTQRAITPDYVLNSVLPRLNVLNNPSAANGSSAPKASSKGIDWTTIFGSNKAAGILGFTDLYGPDGAPMSSINYSRDPNLPNSAYNALYSGIPLMARGYQYKDSLFGAPTNNPWLDRSQVPIYGEMSSPNHLSVGQSALLMNYLNSDGNVDVNDPMLSPAEIAKYSGGIFRLPSSFTDRAGRNDAAWAMSSPIVGLSRSDGSHPFASINNDGELNSGSEDTGIRSIFDSFFGRLARVLGATVKGFSKGHYENVFEADGKTLIQRDSNGNIVVNGSSNPQMSTAGLPGNLARLISSPSNAKEEMIGQAFQVIAEGESGKRHWEVNPRDGSSYSVGLLQWNDGRAKDLMTQMSQELSGQDKVDAAAWAHKAGSFGKNSKKHLTSTEERDLENFLKSPSVAPVSERVQSRQIINDLDKINLRPLMDMYADGRINDQRSLYVPAYAINAYGGIPDFKKRYKSSGSSANDIDNVYSTIMSMYGVDSKGTNYGTGFTKAASIAKSFGIKHQLSKSDASAWANGSLNAVGFGPAIGYGPATLGDKVFGTSSYLAQAGSALGEFESKSADIGNALSASIYTATNGRSYSENLASLRQGVNPSLSTGLDNIMTALGGTSGSSYATGNVTTDQNALVRQMQSVQNQLLYSTDAHEQNPDAGVGSCASTVGWAYNKILGNQLSKPLSVSSAIQSSHPDFTTVYKSGIDLRGNGIGSYDTSRFMPGDLLYYRRKDTKADGKPYGIGHVEMYVGDGRVIGHGGPDRNDRGTRYRNLSGVNQGEDLVMARRWNGFLKSSTVGYGSGEGKYDLRPAKIASLKDRIERDADMEAIRLSHADIGGADESGTTSNHNIGKILEAMSTAIIESKMDTMIAIMKAQLDKEPTSTNVNLTNLNRNVGGSTVVASSPKTNSAPISSMRSIHDRVARR